MGHKTFLKIEKIEKPKFSNDNLLKTISIMNQQSDQSINTQKTEKPLSDKISEVSE